MSVKPTKERGGLLGAVLKAPWLAYRSVRAVVIGVVAVGLCASAVVATAQWEISRRLPPDSRDISDAREVTSVTVLAANGDLLGVRGQRFQNVTVEEAGPLIVGAILAAEDRRFFWHAGVDPIGTMRAIVVNWRAGATEQGGSSLTQQVAKSFVGSEQDLRRKIRELAFALALEARYTKDEILELYLNRAYLGAGAYGFRAAARLYFGVELEDVTAGQAALLAGLLRAPSDGFAAARARALSIIEGMYRNGVLTYDETIRAWIEVETIQANAVPESASYFVDWVVSTVPPEVWERTDDIIVRTTLDIEAQRAAETAIERVFAAHDGVSPDAEASVVVAPDTEASVVVMSTDGAVRAMVGAREYDPTQRAFNIAAHGVRHLGSAFKPFIYAAGFEAGLQPGASVLDARFTVQSGGRPYSPPNYSHNYRGRMPLAEAIARSSNVASLRILYQTGIDRTIALARRAGFEGDIERYYPLALGTLDTNPLEVASAYAIFVNEGRRTPAYAIVEILDRDGNVLWRHRPEPGPQAIPPRHAEWIVSFLRGVVDGGAGTGRRARLEDGRPAAGKTGTTDDYSDAWFAGFTGDYIGVVWVGYREERREMDGVSGGTIPAIIWRETMTPIHAGLPHTPLADSRIPPSSQTVAGAGGGGGGGAPVTITSAQRADEQRERERRRAAEIRAREERAAEERRERRERRESWHRRIDR